LVLLGFQKFFKPQTARLFPDKKTAAEMPQEQAARTVEKPAAYVPEKAEQKPPFKEKETIIQTDKHTIVFSDIGGTIKEIRLRDYRGEDEEEELLLSKAEPGEGIFEIRSPNITGLENAKYELIRGEGYIEYEFSEPGLAEIKKVYNFHKSFKYIELAIKVRNLSSKDMSFSYEVKGPLGMVRSDKVMGRSFLESTTMIDGKVMRKRAIKAPQENAGNISWTALKNRYFTVVFKPFTPPQSIALQGAPDGGMKASFKSKRYLLKPGEAISENYVLYAGEQNAADLAALGSGIENVVDYGIFGGISKLLLSVLNFFYKGTKNWGAAIILLTVLINAILFPLTKKSVVSMHQMKKIQPHMQKLKDLHKDNPHKLNKEMMELYKKYNVNPLSGCLPLLLQMPIFIALYQGLIRSVELKGASFLWIKDLARPDAVGLPFSLPLIGASINILPLLMVVMMVVQQKISQGATTAAMTDEQASQQKMMMVVFPLVFGFLFYNMPSGLVLYWLTNTILMTSEQKVMGKFMERS
jgi:YidC/Oxa1 family membrane protein insertase